MGLLGAVAGRWYSRHGWRSGLSGDSPRAHDARWLCWQRRMLRACAQRGRMAPQMVLQLFGVFTLSASVARPLYRAEGLLADALDARRLAAAEAAPIRIEYNEKGRMVGECREQGPSTVEKTLRVIDRPASAAPPMPQHQAIVRTTTCSKLRSPRDSASMCSR